MKRFALLRLENNANKVILDTNAITLTDAIETFNKTFTPATPRLNAEGYAKVNETVSLCIAEYYQPFHTI